MKIYTFYRRQCIPVSLEKAWDFFSNPGNLAAITPPGVSFTVTSSEEKVMYPGMIIRYSIRPLFGVPVTWVSEIKHIIERKQFVDEQKAGPYRMWYHIHRFEEIENGVRMTDTVHYAMPYGIFGRIAHGLFVRQKLNSIFDFRHTKVIEMFGEYRGE